VPDSDGTPCALLAQAGAGAQATQAQARSQRLCKL